MRRRSRSRRSNIADTTQKARGEGAAERSEANQERKTRARDATRADAARGAQGEGAAQRSEKTGTVQGARISANRRRRRGL